MVPTVGPRILTEVKNKLLWYLLWVLEYSLWSKIGYCGTYCGLKMAYSVYILIIPKFYPKLPYYCYCGYCGLLWLLWILLTPHFRRTNILGAILLLRKHILAYF